MIVSNCCGASYAEPGHPDIDICSACGEHSDAIDQDKPSINVIEMSAYHTEKKCANCRCTYIGHGHNGAPLVEGFICDTCQVEVLEMRLKELKEGYYGKVNEGTSVSDRT